MFLFVSQEFTVKTGLEKQKSEKLYYYNSTNYDRECKHAFIEAYLHYFDSLSILTIFLSIMRKKGIIVRHELRIKRQIQNCKI